MSNQFVQIASAAVPDQAGRMQLVLFALNDSGEIWCLTDGEWREVPSPGAVNRRLENS
jgi:hypothetical protein